MNGKTYAQFARRPNEIFQRLGWAVVPAALIIYVSWSVARLAYVAVMNSKSYSWIVLPSVAFVAFMIFLLFSGGRTVYRAYANRHLPLVVVDEVGVTLYRTRPVTVPWTELTGASLERGYRGSTTLLRLELRDPAVSEAGSSGRVIDLRALAAKPVNLLDAIQSHLRQSEGRL